MLQNIIGEEISRLRNLEQSLREGEKSLYNGSFDGIPKEEINEAKQYVNEGITSVISLQSFLQRRYNMNPHELAEQVASGRGYKPETNVSFYPLSESNYSLIA